MIYVFTFLCFPYLFAQNNPLNFTQGVATSPEMAMLGRFGDIPVSTYNGTIGIEIPLYVLEEYGVEIPISLRYHSSGIRVSDEASNVGLGWALDIGGAIVQSVNGVADEDDRLPRMDSVGFWFVQNNIPVLGTYTPRPSVGTNIFCNSNSAVGDTYMLGYYASRGHGQPDIYYYNLPSGLSGKFYINPIDKQIVFIDKKIDLHIEKVDVDKWVIKDLNGIKYVFNAHEKVEQGIENRGASWKLTQIELINGRTIDFSYIDNTGSTTYYSERYHSPFLNRFPILEPPGINRHTDLISRYLNSNRNRK